MIACAPQYATESPAPPQDSITLSVKSCAPPRAPRARASRTAISFAAQRRAPASARNVRASNQQNDSDSEHQHVGGLEYSLRAPVNPVCAGASVTSDICGCRKRPGSFPALLRGGAARMGVLPADAKSARRRLSATLNRATRRLLGGTRTSPDRCRQPWRHSSVKHLTAPCAARLPVHQVATASRLMEKSDGSVQHFISESPLTAACACGSGVPGFSGR